MKKKTFMFKLLGFVLVMETYCLNCTVRITVELIPHLVFGKNLLTWLPN
uniref:Uncharacterized protein n=1 Tax=Arundo donax TaxID=35708 RepID=A0A0A8ZN73_ARUDO